MNSMIDNLKNQDVLPLYLTQEETYDMIDFIETELIGTIQRSPEMDNVDYVVNICRVLGHLRQLYKTFKDVVL